MLHNNDRTLIIVEISKNMLNLKSGIVSLWQPSFKTRGYVIKTGYPLCSRHFTTCSIYL